MIAEGDEKLADFSDEKFPDSGDESSRIYHDKGLIIEETNIIVEWERWRTYKYSYEFDENDNWIVQRKSVEVNKFGKTHLEPTEIVNRELTYY